MGFFSTLKSDLAGGLNLLSSAFVKPITTITQTAKVLVNPTQQNKTNLLNTVQSVTNQSVKQNITSTIKTTAIAAAAIVPAIKISSAVGSSAFTSIAANPIKSAAIAAITTPILVSSGKARESIIQTPASVFNFGSNLGSFIDKPSVSTGTTIFKENPVVSSLAVGGSALGLGILGSKLINPIVTAQNTAALRDNTQISAEIPKEEKVKEQVIEQTQPIINIVNQLPDTKDINPLLNTSPENTLVTTPVAAKSTSTVKTKKKKKKAKPKKKKAKKKALKKKKTTKKKKKSKKSKKRK
jgi:hypothetical protein